MWHKEPNEIPFHNSSTDSLEVVQEPHQHAGGGRPHLEVLLLIKKLQPGWKQVTVKYTHELAIH